MPKRACVLDRPDCREMSFLIGEIFNNSGIAIYVYTNKDDIDKLNKVEANTLKQEELFDIIQKTS